MKTELDETKEKLEQAQNDLSAWKFTPDRYTFDIINATSNGLLLACKVPTLRAWLYYSRHDEAFWSMKNIVV